VIITQLTDQQAIPTVALASLQRGLGGRKLTLPGTIQAYHRVAIYAQVTPTDGYGGRAERQ
jgi:hypothetical protein